MKSKTIWVINQYGSLPATGIGGRHRHISRELSSLGFKVTFVAARWTHGTRDEAAADNAPELEKFEGFDFLRLPVLKYKHAHDKKRVLNWFLFALKLFKVKKKLNERPDIILYSSPSLVGYLSAYILAKKYKAKLVFEIRDIWPLTLIKLGSFSSRHPFILFLQWVEDFAYKKSDFVISNLEGAIEHAKSRGLPSEKFSWIPNGYSESEVKKNKAPSSEIITALNYQPFSITYTGTLGEANSLSTLLEAARELSQNKDIHFNIFGRGRLEDDLKARVCDMGLKNFHFWGALPKEEVQSVLHLSDACVICWKRSSLYNYGVAANKLFDYLYSSRPIINAYSGGYDIVSRYKSGLTVEAEDPIALANAINHLYEMPLDERLLMGSDGVHAVSEYHEYSKVTEKLASIISRL